MNPEVNCTSAALFPFPLSVFGVSLAYIVPLDWDDNTLQHHLLDSTQTISCLDHLPWCDGVFHFLPTTRRPQSLSYVVNRFVTHTFVCVSRNLMVIPRLESHVTEQPLRARKTPVCSGQRSYFSSSRGEFNRCCAR